MHYTLCIEYLQINKFMAFIEGYSMKEREKKIYIRILFPLFMKYGFGFQRQFYIYQQKCKSELFKIKQKLQ